jgi:hypothetical protein
MESYQMKAPNGPPSKICFIESGFCYRLGQNPPIHWEPFIVDEGDKNYSNLISDAQALHVIHQAAKSLSDDAARTALQSGIASAKDAVEKRGKVVIHLND